MKPEECFLRQPQHFWANVRTISEQVGYTATGTGQVKEPTLAETKAALQKRGLDSLHIADEKDHLTDFGNTLFSYFEHRAKVLNTFVESRLMDAAHAKAEYERLYSELSPQCPIPMNKQKREKRAPAYLTALVNMLIEANAEGLPCDYDPQKLTTLTREGVPLRTLARRVDGAFTSTVNPIAVWEIKEYYYTTTFGSRIADGVYETLLDGLELEELREHEKVDVKHYLIIDAYYTWWVKGKSYLCRIVDMLHVGYVDEVLFGCEVVERLPELVAEWTEVARKRDKHANKDQLF